MPQRNSEEAKKFGEVEVGIKEYYCYACDQLRLNVSGFVTQVCGNCGSKDFVIGDVDTLDKKNLSLRGQREKAT